MISRTERVKCAYDKSVFYSKIKFNEYFIPLTNYYIIVKEIIYNTHHSTAKNLAILIY